MISVSLLRYTFVTELMIATSTSSSFSKATRAFSHVSAHPTPVALSWTAATGTIISLDLRDSNFIPCSLNAFLSEVLETFSSALILIMALAPDNIYFSIASIEVKAKLAFFALPQPPPE